MVDSPHFRWGPARSFERVGCRATRGCGGGFLSIPLVPSSHRRSKQRLGQPPSIMGLTINPLHQLWPTIDETGVELNQAGAGGDFGGGVCGGHDAADGDEGDLALAVGVQVADDFGRAGGQRSPAQAARTDFLDA